MVGASNEISKQTHVDSGGVIFLQHQQVPLLQRVVERGIQPCIAEEGLACIDRLLLSLAEAGLHAARLLYEVFALIKRSGVASESLLISSTTS